jgi:hypothetical protein
MELKVGQVWRFIGRENDPDPRCVIAGIESEEDYEIVHVYLDGIHIVNPKRESGKNEWFGHIPIDREDLEKSLVEMIGTSDIPEITLEGINIWRNDQGGIFAYSLAEVLDFVEDMFNK